MKPSGNGATSSAPPTLRGRKRNELGSERSGTSACSLGTCRSNETSFASGFPPRDSALRRTHRVGLSHILRLTMLSDWLRPTPDFLMGRGLMGEDVIEIRKLRAAVEAAGYDGPIEVEIFNE